ncbi:MAG: DUF1292 domain-containing protein [Clostridiales bacterium]|jgi:uncharacterized protein YrzB (UPF0473 family)|nr:DUF1292 domain-containing protein [Clostridiales bacterium]
MSENEELDNIVVLTDDEGKDIEFEWLDTVEMGEEQYIVLLPIEDEEAEEVVILKMEADEEQENFIPVEDEEELNEVYDLFKERNKENFDFVD